MGVSMTKQGIRIRKALYIVLWLGTLFSLILCLGIAFGFFTKEKIVTKEVEKEVQVPTVIEAPVTKGQKAGWVKYFVDGTEFAAYPIIICETVGAFDYWHCLKQIIKGFLL